MKVALHSNMCDQATHKIAGALHEPFRTIGAQLSGDYGGIMDHLWMDFELIRSHCESRPPKPFRFQKKVGGGICHLTGLPTPVYLNVGHYKVRPDFDILLNLPLSDTPTYALSLIHYSTAVLEEKKKRLGGFNATSFRDDFISICRKNGYKFSREHNQW